eukprot:CAMPEP_0177663940 /NCGR_PEP_ID=MMETSP0447-20121125/20199_1 /TAXON_ID=0 /ORGANISM="Stygamoeba regulata, Strain BSH-02190019" /LENGTH=139 /DNA_ID=CAMNT_0019169821 /DNA_START=323 /DNA_END=739 /DNA_ORIENTATION=-
MAQDEWELPTRLPPPFTPDMLTENWFQKHPVLKDTLSFVAFGDFGNCNMRTADVARAIQAEFQDGEPLDFVLACGDNFYPSGVSCKDDPLFQTVWRDVWLEQAALNCPWFVCLGNHDYCLNPGAQIEFTHHSANPGGLW